MLAEGDCEIFEVHRPHGPVALQREEPRKQHVDERMQLALFDGWAAPCALDDRVEPRLLVLEVGPDLLGDAHDHRPVDAGVHEEERQDLLELTMPLAQMLRCRFRSELSGPAPRTPSLPVAQLPRVT